jgi:hypothetical protein
MLARMDDEITAKLKQFETLWGEIARRSNAQQALIGAAVAATGTVGGLVVGDKASVVLLAVLAGVVPVFGLLWLDHAQNIGQVSDFISEHWGWEPNWERNYKMQLRSPARRIRYFLFIVAMTLVFVGPAVAGLVASFGHLDGQTGRIAGWAGAAAISLLFTVAWLLHVIRTWRLS